MTIPDAWRALARTLIGEPEFTADEVATQAAVDREEGKRLWRALGFPPVPDGERAFTQCDVAMLRAARALLEHEDADPEMLLQLTRVTGQALSRVAEAQVAASVERITARQGDVDSTTTAAEAIAARTAALLPAIESFLTYTWRRHTLAALLRVAAGDRRSLTDHSLAVGFADLVGFTAISQQLSDRELATMVDRFEALVYLHVPERGGRVVKMIGDEVLFSVEDAATAAEMALALIDACAADEALPAIRVGLAYGPTLSWEGDIFGPTVNLASRLVNVARAGTVLVSDDLRQKLQGAAAFDLRGIRPISLKGIGRTHVWILRRASPAAEPPLKRRFGGVERWRRGRRRPPRGSATPTAAG